MADVNGDGLLDIYITNNSEMDGDSGWGVNHLFVNRGGNPPAMRVWRRGVAIAPGLDTAGVSEYTTLQTLQAKAGCALCGFPALLILNCLLFIMHVCMTMPYISPPNSR
jgi:hypothetical protein